MTLLCPHRWVAQGTAANTSEPCANSRIVCVICGVDYRPTPEHWQALDEFYDAVERGEVLHGSSVDDLIARARERFGQQ